MQVNMQKKRWNVAAIALAAAALLGGCGSDSPTAPNAFEPPPGTHQALVSAVTGSGFGGVSVSPKAVPEATFTADIKVRLHRARPNTSFVVQRAAELGRASGSDGVCQRALGVPPWSPADPPAPSFVSFPIPAPGPLVTLTTSADGEASLDFEFRSGIPLAAGTQFDVMFRLVDDTVAPSTELRSGCFTVTAR